MSLGFVRVHCKLSACAFLYTIACPLILFAEAKATLPEAIPFEKEKLHVEQNHDSSLEPPNRGGSGDLSNSLGVTRDIRISGEVTAGRSSELSFRVAGFISSISAKPGSVIKKGDVIAELDGSDFRLGQELAEANLEQAKNQEDITRKEYDREKQLKQENASSEAAFERALSTYKQTQLGVKLSSINLRTAKKNVENTKIIAPYDCIIASQFKEEAEYVAIGAKVVEVYETSDLEVSLNFPENLVDQIQVGRKLTVFVPSTSYKDEAVIVRVVPVISNTNRTFQVTAKLVNASKKIVPGLFVEAQFN